MAQLARGGRGVLFKAYLRSVTNTAIAVGSLVGGAALLVDEAWAYVAVFVANAVLTAFAAWNTTRLPHLPAYTRSAGEPRLAVLRDWPYVVITAMTGLFALHFIVMELRAYLSYERKDLELAYWRSTSQFEVDFIVGDELAIEVKSTDLVTDRHLKGLRALKEEKNLVRNFMVVSLDKHPRTTEDGIHIVPWRVFTERLWASELW